MPLSTLQATSRDAICKTEGQDGVAVSFLVGLFHSLQHAGLTRRSLVNAVIVQVRISTQLSTVRNLSGYPTNVCHEHERRKRWVVRNCLT